MNSSSVAGERRQPRSASRSSWRAQDLARRGDDRRRRRPSAGRPGTARCPSCHGMSRSVSRSGAHLEVAVAALPRAHRVAVDGVHLDVDGEQVVARLGAVLEHLVEEVLRREALALQAALHVGQGEQRRCRPRLAPHQLSALRGAWGGKVLASILLTQACAAWYWSGPMRRNDRGPEVGTDRGRARRADRLRRPARRRPPARGARAVRPAGTSAAGRSARRSTRSPRAG